jgi:hypothetical protein
MMPIAPSGPGARELERFRRLAVLFDSAVRIPGTRWRFGVDAVLGLVPGVGDIAGAAFALYGIHVARLVGAPLVVQTRMLLHIALDVLAGTVPVVGDFFDIAFKAHARNSRLLDKWLENPSAVARRSKVALLAPLVAALGLLLAVCGLALWAFVACLRWLAGFF